MSAPLPLVRALSDINPEGQSVDGMLSEALWNLTDRLDGFDLSQAIGGGRNAEYRRLLTLVEMIEAELKLDHWRRYGY